MVAFHPKQFFNKIYPALLFLLLFSICSERSYGQTDTEFWFVAPEITEGHGIYPGGEPVYFRVSALELDAVVRIYQPANPGGLDTTFTVTARSTESIDASPWIDDLENRPGGVILNKGVLIESDNLITVYYDEDEYWNQDIFALKGGNALGYEFYTPFQSLWPNGNNYTPLPYSSIDIVATEDLTEITITPTVDFVGGFQAGVPFTIYLDKGETFSCLATSQSAAAHAAGTHIVSDKPIAVTLKDDSVSGNPCKDLVGDQTVPVVNADGDQIVGHEYIVMRGKINWGSPNADPPDPPGIGTGERIFIMATQPNTQVFIDGTLLATLANPGQHAIYELSENATHVLGDKPVMVLHTAGFGCELGGAILPTIDGCTGSVEVSFTRSTDRNFYLNIMTNVSAMDAFTMHYEDGSSYDIPGSWFEPVGSTGFVCLSNNNKLFKDSIGGGVPQGEVVKITNSISVFHLGLIEGGTTTGCKYGYFSDYSESRGDVLVVESGSKSIARCFGDTVQLRASGGITYSWAPSDYLSDPNMSSPIATPPPGIHNYNVTMKRGCFPDTTIPVIVAIADQVEAFFEMDEWYICAPDTLTFSNQSFGVDLSSEYYTKWDFDLGDTTNLFVYDTSSVFQVPFTTDLDTVDRRTIQLTVWNEQSCASEFRRDVLIRPEIHAGFTTDLADGCQPLHVNFTNTSTGNTDRYKWDLGDGNSSNTPHVSHTYFNHGMADSLYHVEMVAISPFYCTDTVASDIAVYPYLEAAFALDTFQGCSPLQISIDNNSAGYIEEYEWDFGDDSTSASGDDILQHTWINTGDEPVDYTIRLVVRNDTRGCTDTLVRTVTVFPQVLSFFMADKASVCHGSEVNFSNWSSASATSFQWDFGDGGSSSADEPPHIFENLSPDSVDYTVRLVSTSEHMCRDTAYGTVRTHPYVHAEFSVEEFQGCAPFQLELQNASAGGISDFEWDWGDETTPSPSGDSTLIHEYNNTGDVTTTHDLQLVVQNAAGCSDTMTREIRVFPEVVSSFTPVEMEGCNELAVSFQNQSSASATSFLWEFGDGASSDEIDPAHIFRNPGLADSTYFTRLIAATPENCRDTSQAEIQVWSYVRADFTFEQATLCSPFELVLNNTSVGGVEYHWDFGDTSDSLVSGTDAMSHFYTNPSDTDPVTYTITLTATNSHGCQSVMSKDITVMPAVHADFGLDMDEGCNPLTVEFFNNSSGATSYNWDFDNGQSSNDSNPDMTFENYGTEDRTFNVELTVTNVYNCQDSFSLPVTVHPHVEADFAIEYLRQCSEAEILFHNSSLNGQNYNWDFDGDLMATTSTDSILRRFINDSPTTTASFPVSLRVTSPQGCTDSLTREVQVFHRVTAAFTSITEGCSPLEVEFTNTSEGARDYSWDFGDQTSSILSGPTHIYQNEGYEDSVYTVRLTAVSENYCSDTSYARITAFPVPRAKFNADRTDGCSPLDINVENLSEAGTSFTWTFGDNSANQVLDDLSAVAHQYVNDQDEVSYPVLRLDVSNERGCSDFITQTISVYPVVVAAFEADSAGCSPFSSQFSNHSEGAHTYTWDFGDGGFAYITDPGHTFVNSGENNLVLDVELTALSQYGCSDSAVRQVTVYPSPVARFNYNPIYQYFPNTTVTLSNETNTGDYEFQWDFDDGTQSSLRDPDTHTFEHWGEYHITLTASNSQCADSVTHWVKVFPPQPVALYTTNVDSGCAPLTVALTNNSLYGEEYLWEFDDGSTSTEFEPGHTFHEAGIYQVKLTVVGEGGVDVTFHQFEVFPIPEPQFTVKPTLVMLPDELVKTYDFSKHAEEYRWDMGDGTTYDLKETRHLYTQEGVYDVSLTIWSIHGCEATLVIPEAVTVLAEGEMKFPDAFAPARSGPSDGYYNPNDVTNQVFYPIHTGVVKYKLVIYNRWGEKLFTTEDVNQGWDGYHKGKLCAQGVYVWKAEATFANSVVETQAGDVTLLWKPK